MLFFVAKRGPKTKTFARFRFSFCYNIKVFYFILLSTGTVIGYLCVHVVLMEVSNDIVTQNITLVFQK